MTSNFDAPEQTPILLLSEIAKMKERYEHATPEPWKSYIEGQDQTSGSSFIMTKEEDIYLQGASVANLDFIAHARQDIPRLVAEIERLSNLVPK